MNGHCLTGIKGKEIEMKAVSLLALPKSMSLDVPFGNKILHASGMCHGVYPTCHRYKLMTKVPWMVFRR